MITWTNEQRKLSDLIPWPRNPRQIKEVQAKRLADSFDEFGQVETLAIGPGNEIYNGHQRLNVLAAEHGPDHEVEVRVASRQLTEKEREKLTVYLHKGAAGEWDFDILANQFEVTELVEWGFEPLELGIDLASDNVGSDTPPQIDKAAELQKKWGTALGQVWELGPHRLVCGDCTDKAVVEAVMRGEVAEKMFTDPPYNVGYQDNESIESLKKRNRRTDGLTVANDAMSDEDFAAFLDLSLANSALPKGGVFYLCAPPGHTETLFRNILNNVSGWSLKQCIVWVKDRFVFGRQDYHYRHESILYGWIEGAAHYFLDDRTQDTVWEFDRPRVSEFHPTMKPVGLPEKAIENNSHINGIIYEPFCGSGTTIIAAHNLNRRARAIEIDPGYVAVSLERFWEHTQIEPKLI